MAQGDILKIEPITRIKIYETLTFLCYQMDDNIEQKKRNKNSLI